MIVTDARVMKCYHKLVDDGILPEKFELLSTGDEDSEIAKLNVNKSATLSEDGDISCREELSLVR